MDISELIYQGFQAILSWQTMLYLFGGVLLGTIAGSLPGFTSGNTCAIVLPLTLSMSPINAIVFMGAIYAGAQYGGGIPAILFNVPGTPQAAATALDGYQLTKQGKPDFALGVSMMASALGTIISAVIALFAMVPVARLALKFGPAEMFLLSMMGVAIISCLVGDDIKKGFVVAVLGFLVSCMAADPYYGYPRLNFGFLELYDKVPLVASMIGLFAIPTILALSKSEFIMECSKEDAKNIGKISGIFKGVAATIKKPIQVLSASLIGTFIGAVPGTGAGISTFVTYGLFTNTSKHPETFGKGDMDGIIAGEASNNGCSGGAMIPTFALGVPGSGTTAIMLSVLMLHGIIPGPNVVSEHGTMVSGFLLTLLLAGVLIIPIGLGYCAMFARIIKVRSSVLIPILIILCLLGAFGERQFIFDMGLLLVFGILGLLLELNHYPMVPFLFGIILGPIAEANFLRSVTLSQGSLGIFFSSSICLIMWVVIVAVFVVPAVSKKLRNRETNKAAV
jgi:putative tricarboxylic transport membrane protein